MARAEILLLKKVADLGYEGDVAEVAAGYARNYLLPQGFAIPVTAANKKQIAALQVRRLEREKKEFQEARELAEKIREIVVSFAVKTGANGKMFGAVTASDLAKKISEVGFVIDRRKIQLDPVKHIGQASAKIRLHPEVIVDFAFEVTAEA